MHFSLSLPQLFILLITFSVTEELSHKLKLLKEVALELSKGEDKKVVMWMFDSFSTLVTNATRDSAANNSGSVAAYAGVVVTVFNLNDSMIPVAVCSSATTAGELSESN